MLLQNIIGLHSCREALKARPSKDLKKLYFKPEWHKSLSLLELARIAEQKKIKPEVISLKKLNRIGDSHQGVCVVANHCLKFDISSIGPNAVVLILDRIQDPRNLGAIIRTAWLMGVKCIFSSCRKSAVLSPSVIKVASGGVEYVPIEIKDKLRQCMEELKKNQFWVYALDSQSQNRVWETKLEGRIAFLMGGESFGVRPGLKKFCDEDLSIPQTQKDSSYNVSVATGIVLGEYSRQRSLND